MNETGMHIREGSIEDVISTSLKLIYQARMDGEFNASDGGIGLWISNLGSAVACWLGEHQEINVHDLFCPRHDWDDEDISLICSNDEPVVVLNP